MRRRTARLTTAVGVLALLATACGGGDDGGGEAGGTEKVRIVLPADAVQFLDVYVAAEQGFFQRNGVETEITLTPGPAATIAAMAGGAADVGLPFTEQALAAMEKGAKFKIFAGEYNRIMATVVGAKGVSGAAGLRGQKVATSNVDDILTLIMIDELAKQGLPGGDYDRIIIGSSGQRFQSLQTGAIKGTVLTQPIDRQALREGYPSVLEISQPGFFTGHIGTEKFLGERTAAAGKYVKAIQQATDWLLDPANKAAVVGVLVKRVKVTQADAEATYDLVVPNKVFVSGAPIDAELLKVPLSYLEKTGRVGAGADPAKYVDRRALEAAGSAGG